MENEIKNLNDADIDMIKSLYLFGFAFVLENGRIVNMIMEKPPEIK